jgi:hypothetical protein
MIKSLVYSPHSADLYNPGAAPACSRGLNVASQSFQRARVKFNNQLMMPKATHDHRSTLGYRLVGFEWRLADMHA